MATTGSTERGRLHPSINSSNSYAESALQPSLPPPDREVSPDKYEVYRITPVGSESSEERWSFAHKTMEPATQGDLRKEVMRQRNSGRSAWDEYSDLRGPKRDYIQRLVKKRNATFSGGHYEVAGLKLEQEFSKDVGRGISRNHGRRGLKKRTISMTVILECIIHARNKLSRVLPEATAAQSGRDEKLYPVDSNHHAESQTAVPIKYRNRGSLGIHWSDQQQLPVQVVPPHSIDRQHNNPVISCQYTSRGTQTSLGSTHFMDPAVKYMAGFDTQIGEHIHEDRLNSDDDATSFENESVAESQSRNTLLGEGIEGPIEYQKPPW